jgi:sugar O-acyltransferase (sialic acid O-acetyltransferase NeuD family)
VTQVWTSAEMMKRDLLVIGGGGHAKVVIDLALRSGAWRITGVLDDAEGAMGKSVLGCEVLGGTGRISQYSAGGSSFVVAIGSNAVRERLQATSTSAGLVAATLIHPSAIVAESARIGEGAVVMAGVVINADARIGKGVIVNTGAVIDHDCQLGDYCHVAPGVKLCGSVSIGSRSLVGVGASVIPGIVIGSDCVIGAGAAVVSQVPNGNRVVGVPARVIKVV